MIKNFSLAYLKKVFYSLGGGLRQSLRFEEFRRFPIVVPPLEEQKLISRYLDKKTEQIDRLVEKIQKKIELLKQQRTSMINQCVTKGLDPNVEMKDSGIEWIGKIPKHWELIRLKYLFSLEGGKDPKLVETEDGEYPILGTGGLAMIIPPSALGVLLASVANIDVGRLLVAGFLPGFVLAALYATLIYLQIRLIWLAILLFVRLQLYSRQTSSVLANSWKKTRM